MVSATEIRERVLPLFIEIDKQCQVTEHFIDKERWRIYLATMWCNLVLEPESLGIEETDLETAFDVVEAEATKRLGGPDALVESFRFLTTKDGGVSMDKAKIRKNHRDMLLYFASMMIDPEGHRQYMEEIRKKS